MKRRHTGLAQSCFDHKSAGLLPSYLFPLTSRLPSAWTGQVCGPDGGADAEPTTELAGVFFNSPTIVSTLGPDLLKPGTIERVGGSVVTGGLNHPSGLAADSSGNLYFGDVTGGPMRVHLKKRALDGTVSDLGLVVDTTGGGVGVGGWGFDVAVSPTGEIFYNSPTVSSMGMPIDGGVDGGGGGLKSGTIEKLGGGVVVDGLHYPSGLAFDAAGNLYFGDVTYGPLRIHLMKRAVDGTVSNLGLVVDTSGGAVPLGIWGFDVAVSPTGEVFYNSPPVVGWPTVDAGGGGAGLKSGTIEQLGVGVVDLPGVLVRRHRNLRLRVRSVGSGLRSCTTRAGPEPPPHLWLHRWAGHGHVHPARHLHLWRHRRGLHGWQAVSDGSLLVPHGTDGL